MTFKHPLALLLGATLAAAALAQTTALPTPEQADLRYMREEEKLARDVYAALGAQWKLNTFANIERSEQQHTTTVAALLKQHGLADPAATLAAGKFADPTLQQLYDQLIKDGSASRVAALKVGAAIEEIDIRDLDERIARSTTADIRLAYENLRRASWNHLTAFTRNLQREGVTYVPQYLDKAAYARQIGSRR